MNSDHDVHVHLCVRKYHVYAILLIGAGLDWTLVQVAIITLHQYSRLLLLYRKIILYCAVYV